MAINATTWRTAPYASDAFVYISRPQTVFAARVNMASANYPLTSLTYDGVTTGSASDIKPGYTLLLGSTAGGYDYGIQRVRAAADATTIPVGRSSRGELTGELRAVDNAYITVLKERRVWAKIPRIDGTTIYKDELAFSEDLVLAPVVVMQEDYLARVDATTGLITVTFDGSASYALSGSIASYAWDFDGGTVTAGGANQATATVTFEEGEYDVSLTVTDSGGRSSTSYRWIVAASRDSSGDYACIPVELGAIARRVEGQEAAIVVRGADIPQTTYYPGTRVGIFEEEWYGATQTSLTGAARGQVKFTGWLDTEVTEIEAAREGLRRSVTINLIDIGGALRRIPRFPDTLIRKSSATTWNHIPAANANLNGAILHYLRWNTTALELADFRRAPGGNNYTFSRLSGEKGTPYEQADRLARAMRCRLGVTSRGGLRVRGYPNYQPTAAQAASLSLPVSRTDDETVTLASSDLHIIRYTDRQFPRNHWNNGSAILVSTQDGEATNRTDTPLFAIAPGTAPGQGANAVESGEQIVYNQDELNCIEGHRYKTNNAEQSYFEIDLTRGGDVFEIADMDWVRLNIPASIAAQRGFTLSNERVLPVEVRREYGAHGMVRQSLIVEREQVGQRAATVTKPSNPNTLPTIPPPSTWIPDTSIVFTPPTGTVFPQIGASRMLRMLNDGNLSRTSTFNVPGYQGGPSWDFVSSGVSGTPVLFIIDASNTNNAFVVTTTGIYKVTTIWGTPSATLQHTFIATNSGRSGDFDYINSPGQFGIIVTNYNSGTNGSYYTRTTDGGETWSAEAQITSGRVTTAGGWSLGVAVSPHRAGYAYSGAVAVSGAEGTSALDTLGYEYNGSVWSAISSDDLSSGSADDSAQGDIHIPYYNNPNDAVFFHGWREVDVSGSAGVGRHFARSSIGGTRERISPVVSGTYYGPDPTRNRWQISTPSGNNRLFLCGTNAGRTASGVWMTTDSRAASVSWTEIVTPSAGNPYKRVAALDPNGAQAILFGTSGAIALWDGSTVDSRLGNGASAAEVIGIAG